MLQLLPWCGNKELMRVALSLDLTAILRMEINTLKYRVRVGKNTRAGREADLSPGNTQTVEEGARHTLESCGDDC